MLLLCVMVVIINKSQTEIGNGTGFHNLYGSRVRVLVGTGAGRDSPTRELQNEPLFIQNG